MAFSMSDIKRKGITTKDYVIRCRNLLRDNNKLTENVRTALWEYCLYRFKRRQNSKFTEKKLNEMCKDLLQYVIQKNYDGITLQDVSINENRIIYEIYRAVHYGAIHHLYYTDSDIISKDDIKVMDSLIEPQDFVSKDRLEKQDVIDYFKGMII